MLKSLLPRKKVEFSSNLLIVASNVVFLLLTVYFLFFSLEVNYLGLEGKFVDGKWIVKSVDTIGEGAKLGVTSGDEILRVDGQPLAQNRSLELWHRFSATQTIQVKKQNGEVLNLSIDIPQTEVLKSFAPMLAVGLLFWLFGNYVIYSKPHWNLAKRIYFFNYLIGLVLISIHATARNIPFSREIELAGILITSPLLTHLVEVLPNKEWKYKISPGFMIWPGLIIFFLHISWNIILWHWIDLYSVLQKLILVYIVVWGIVCTIILVKRYHGSEQVTRNQISILLWCTIAAILPLLVLNFIPFLISGEPLMSVDKAILFVAFIPLSMWYVLSKEKIFDLSFFIRYGTSFIILGFPALALFTWLLVELFGSSVLNTWWKSLIFLCFNLLVIFSYNTWKGTIEDIVEKQFFKDYHDRKKLLKEFQRAILKIHDPELLITSLMDVVEKSLKVEDQCLCLKENGVYFIKSNRGNCKERRLQSSLLSYLSDNLTGITDPFQLPRHLGMEYAIPILGDEGAIGILFLGLKSTRIKFLQDDIIMVRSLLDNFSIGLENSQLLSSTRKQFDTVVKEMASISQSSVESRWLNRMLVSAQEEERRKLSSDLHDGPVQLLVQLIRNCQQFADTDNITPEQFKGKTLETCEIAKDILYDLRELCFRLRPSLLDDLGLVPTLQWLINEVKKNSNIEIDFNFEPHDEQVSLNKEVELVLFRATQEIINNTLKHAQASNLKIALKILEHRVALSAVDNGKGFNTTDLLECLQVNRFGLLGMRKRVAWVGGTFAINSSPGLGTSVDISIPNKAAEEEAQWRA